MRNCPFCDAVPRAELIAFDKYFFFLTNLSDLGVACCLGVCTEAPYGFSFSFFRWEFGIYFLIWTIRVLYFHLIVIYYFSIYNILFIKLIIVSSSSDLSVISAHPYYPLIFWMHWNWTFALVPLYLDLSKSINFPKNWTLSPPIFPKNWIVFDA